MFEHKWKDIIIAWANGFPIQNRKIKDHSNYEDCIHLEWEEWKPIFNGKWFPSPDFNSDEFEWRIKPKEKITAYRVAVLKDSNDQPYFRIIQMNEGDSVELTEELLLSRENFVSWMTGWCDYRYEVS